MKLSDGKIVYEITKNEIAWEGMGKLCLASAILENTATEYERKQAMDMLNEVKFVRNRESNQNRPLAISRLYLEA